MVTRYCMKWTKWAKSAHFQFCYLPWNRAWFIPNCHISHCHIPNCHISHCHIPNCHISHCHISHCHISHSYHSIKLLPQASLFIYIYRVNALLSLSYCPFIIGNMMFYILMSIVKQSICESLSKMLRPIGV